MVVDENAFNNLKSSEAYQYVHSNKVGCVYQHGSFVYLRANVQPSKRVSDSWRSAWVVVMETGDMETAGCTSVAGPAIL